MSAVLPKFWPLSMICSHREDFDTILDITKFKTHASWGIDPMKSVETKVKSAFTRSFNKMGLPVKCTIMVEDGKKAKGARGKVADLDDEEVGGEIAEVCYLSLLPYSVFLAFLNS
jgi:hypothetical protein